MRLKPKETLSSLFARITALRRRLLNWTPRLELPDQLILVCILRALPTNYSSTCTIIMATRNIDLSTAKTMLLDAENADARLIMKNLGSGANTNRTSHGNPVGNALTVGTIPKKKEKKYTAAYLKEGPCPEHPDGCHAKSECWKLHPELRPKKKKKVAAANVVCPEVSESLYGFLTGNCLIATHGMHCMHEPDCVRILPLQSEDNLSPNLVALVSDFLGLFLRLVFPSAHAPHDSRRSISLLEIFNCG